VERGRSRPISVRWLAFPTSEACGALGSGWLWVGLTQHRSPRTFQGAGSLIQSGIGKPLGFPGQAQVHSSANCPYGVLFRACKPEQSVRSATKAWLEVPSRVPSPPAGAVGTRSEKHWTRGWLPGH